MLQWRRRLCQPSYLITLLTDNWFLSPSQRHHSNNVQVTKPHHFLTLWLTTDIALPSPTQHGVLWTRTERGFTVNSPAPAANVGHPPMAIIVHPKGHQIQPTTVGQRSGGKGYGCCDLVLWPPPHQEVWWAEH